MMKVHTFKLIIFTGLSLLTSVYMIAMTPADNAAWWAARNANEQSWRNNIDDIVRKTYENNGIDLTDITNRSIKTAQILMNMGTHCRTINSMGLPDAQKRNIIAGYEKQNALLFGRYSNLRRALEEICGVQ